MTARARPLHRADRHGALLLVAAAMLATTSVAPGCDTDDDPPADSSARAGAGGAPGLGGAPGAGGAGAAGASGASGASAGATGASGMKAGSSGAGGAGASSGNSGASGAAGAVDPCPHAPCAKGANLSPTCSPCVAEICAADPYCCATSWDTSCVDAALATPSCACPGSAGASGAAGAAGEGGAAGSTGTPACAHSSCLPGVALDQDCSPCATAICEANPGCCDVAWTPTCVQQAKQSPSCTCSPAELCPHEPCEAGAFLDPSCSACVASVCSYDPFCCQMAWDGQCVDEAGKDKQCSCVTPPPCPHGPCETGPKLQPSCSPCAAIVCTYDDYCCKTEWDAQCVSEASKEACACDEGSAGQAGQAGQAGRGTGGAGAGDAGAGGASGGP